MAINIESKITMHTEIRNAPKPGEIIARLQELRRQSVEATRQGDFRCVARLTLETQCANAQLHDLTQMSSFSNPSYRRLLS